MKARDHIDCGRCGGTGKVSLPHELAETLSFVRARGTVTSSDVLRELMRDGQGGTPIKCSKEKSDE